MCLAVPGRILEIYSANGLRMGRIDYAGTENTACLEYTPEADEGDYVIVHAGFALQKLDVEEARLSLETLAELDAHMEADAQRDAEDGQ